MKFRRLSPPSDIFVGGLEPYAYLIHLLGQMPTASTTEALEALLPWNVKPLLKAQRSAA